MNGCRKVYSQSSDIREWLCSIGPRADSHEVRAVLRHIISSGLCYFKVLCLYIPYKCPKSL